MKDFNNIPIYFRIIMNVHLSLITLDLNSTLVMVKQKHRVDNYINSNFNSQNTPQ